MEEERTYYTSNSPIFVVYQPAPCLHIALVSPPTTFVRLPTWSLDPFRKDFEPEVDARKVVTTTCQIVSLFSSRISGGLARRRETGTLKKIILLERALPRPDRYVTARHPSCQSETNTDYEICLCPHARLLRHDSGKAIVMFPES